LNNIVEVEAEIVVVVEVVGIVDLHQESFLFDIQKCLTSLKVFFLKLVKIHLSFLEYKVFDFHLKVVHSLLSVEMTVVVDEMIEILIIIIKMIVVVVVVVDIVDVVVGIVVVVVVVMIFFWI
jgi:hypothetical protein